MKSTKRKLSLHSQTLRHLSSEMLVRVQGGYGSFRADMCSTQEDTGCCPTAQTFCATPLCPSEGVGCTSVY
jgi:hypothetical protein